MDNKQTLIYKFYENKGEKSLAFISKVYEPTFNYLREAGKNLKNYAIEITLIPPSSGKIVPFTLTLHDLYLGSTTLNDTLASYSSYNVYYTLGIHDPSKLEFLHANHRRASSESFVGYSNVLVFDFDHSLFHDYHSIPMTPQEYRNLLNRFRDYLFNVFFAKLGITPSFVVYSGGGLHFYFYFEEPFKYEGIVKEKISRFKEAFKKAYLMLDLPKDFEHFDFDVVATSPLRIIKLPYTFVRSYVFTTSVQTVSEVLSEVDYPSFDKFLNGQFVKYQFDDLMNKMIDFDSSISQVSFHSEDSSVSLSDDIKKEFYEDLKKMWKSIFEEFKQNHDISRHFLTVAIHAKLLHHFDIKQNEFVEWFKNELFPYLVSEGLEDQRDLYDRLNGAILRNYRRKEAGVPLGVKAFLKFYDNTSYMQQIYEVLDSILSKFVKKWSSKLQEDNASNVSDNVPGVIITKTFLPQFFADPILKSYHFKYDVYKRFWRYDPKEGIWKEDAELWLASYLRKKVLGPEQQKTHYINEIINYIKDMSFVEDIEFAPPNIIAFKNVLYDLDKDEFLDFSPKYFVTNKLPVKLDPSITSCPKIDSFFESILDEKRKVILYELIAYTLYRDYPYQKVFYLYGVGSNGKSTFLELLANFLGADNIASETPHDLISDKFSIGNLFNKLANISSDISYHILKNPNKLKMLSGGDRIKCERKFQMPFYFKNYAKLIFSTNLLPPTNDKSYAYYRRLYLIEFDKVFDKTNANPTLIYELTDERELSGLAWVSLQYLKKLKERKWRFTIDPSPEEMKEKYEYLSNPVIKFINEKCEEDLSGSISVRQFYREFNLWCKRNGFPMIGTREISDLVQSLGFLKEKKSFVDENNEVRKYWAFSGLRWKEPPYIHKEEKQPSTNDVQELIVNEIERKEKMREHLLTILSEERDLDSIEKEMKLVFNANSEETWGLINKLKAEGLIFEKRPNVYVKI